MKRLLSFSKLLTLAFTMVINLNPSGANAEWIGDAFGEATAFEIESSVSQDPENQPAAELGMVLLNAWKDLEAGFVLAEGSRTSVRTISNFTAFPVDIMTGAASISPSYSFRYVGLRGIGQGPGGITSPEFEFVQIGSGSDPFGSDPAAALNAQLINQGVRIDIDGDYTATVNMRAVANNNSDSGSSSQTQTGTTASASASARADDEGIPVDFVTSFEQSWSIVTTHKLFINDELVHEFETEFSRDEQGNITLSNGLTASGLEDFDNPGDTFEVVGSFSFPSFDIGGDEMNPDTVRFENTMIGFLQTEIEGIVISVPEPSATVSLLTLGTLGSASILKRKLNSSKPTEKKM
jgi:hypothetical protein